jgi:hypothetical protein
MQSTRPGVSFRRALAARAAAVAVLGVVLAACSTTPSGVSQPTQAPSSSTPTTTTSTTAGPTSTSAPSTSTSSTTTSTTAAAAAPCSKAQLALKVGKTQGAAGSIYIGFTLADKTSQGCTLNGYPTIGLGGPGGPVVPQVSHEGQGAIFGDHPSTVALPPGGAAGAGFVLSYSDIQQNGQTSCPQVTAISVTLPGQSTAFHMHERRFYPCGAPNLSVSAIVSETVYHAQYGH